MAKILVIDDDDQVRSLLHKTLEKEGYEVDELPDGGDALRLYEENEYQVVITDIIMPEKEGLETIIQVRRKYPYVKFIAISGGGRISPTDCLSMAERLGANYTFSKPFDRQALLDAVADLCS